MNQHLTPEVDLSAAFEAAALDFYDDQARFLAEYPPVEPGDDFGDLDVDPLRHMAGLVREKKDLERRMKRLKAKIDHEESVVLDHMLNHGIGQQRVDGVTLFPRTEVYASLLPEKTVEDLRAALQASNISDGGIVKTAADSRRLSSLAREYEGELPEPLADVLKVSEVVKLGTRAS